MGRESIKTLPQAPITATATLSGFGRIDGGKAAKDEGVIEPVKYAKVSQEDVYKLLVRTSVDPMNPIGGLISVVNIASLLKTSRYQVKKHVKQLRDAGMVELDWVWLGDDESELIPPYWGYRLTDKGKNTDIYRAIEEIEDRIFRESFGLPPTRPNPPSRRRGPYKGTLP